MAVVKLNEGSAMTKQGKRKASNKDIVRVIGGLINELEAVKQHVNMNTQELQMINGTLDLYIAFNNNGKEFKEYIDEAIQDKGDNELQEPGQDNKESDSANSED